MNEVEQARAGQPGVGDEHVDAGALLGEALDGLGVGEVDRERARLGLGGQGLEDVRAPAR